MVLDEECDLLPDACWVGYYAEVLHARREKYVNAIGSFGIINRKLFFYYLRIPEKNMSDNREKHVIHQYFCILFSEDKKLFCQIIKKKSVVNHGTFFL